MTRPLTHWLSSLLVGSMLVATPACAGRRPPKPALVEDALAWAEKDRAKAIKLLEGSVDSGDVGEDDLPWIMLHLGEQHRLAGDTAAATEWFTRVLRDTTKNKALDGARLGLAVMATDDPTAKGQLVDIKDKWVPATINADRYMLLALDAIERGDSGDVRDYTKDAITWAEEDPAVKERIARTLRAATAAQQPDGPDNPVDPVDPDVEPPKDELSTLDQARLAYQLGRAAEANKLIDAAAKDPANAQAITYLRQMIEAGTKPNPNKIVAILPLEGTYTAAGNQVKEALKFGYERGAGRARLEFVDSGSTPETAVAALEDAVIQGGAGYVVGPLLTLETDAFVAAAEALGVPTISLSQALTDTTEAPDAPARDWTIGGMVTAEHEVAALVDYTMGEKEMKSFAIFAPDTSYGHRGAEAFRAQVEERGGAITIETFYDSKSTDLIPFAKELGRKDYEERWREIRDLRKAAEEKGRDPGKVVLPPKIDFDALFIPDSYKRVPLACAALAFEEFPMGEFVPVKDGPVIPLLGLSAWNNDDLVGSGGEYTRNSFFTDSYAEFGTTSIRWADDYRAELGRSPISREAVTSDVGRLLAEATMADDARTWFDLRDNLFAIDMGDTATGGGSIDPKTAAVRRDIRILSIDREKVLQVHPEPVIIVEPVCEPDAEGNLPEGCENDETDGTTVPG